LVCELVSYRRRSSTPCLQTLPPEGFPSCCCLASRVLTRPRYDAHWLRQASDVWYALEALDTTTRLGLPLSSTVLLWTSASYKVCGYALTAWNSAPPLVSPLSAPSSPDMTAEIPLLLLPVCRFSQPLDETTSAVTRGFIPPRRHSQGYGPSEPDPKPIAGRFRPACFFAVSLPYMVSFRWTEAFHSHAATVFPFATHHPPAPIHLAADGSILGLSQP
jgi:hypothetical protein